MLLEHRCNQRISRGELGQIGGIRPALAAAGDDLVAGLEQFFFTTRHDEGLGAGLGDLERRGLADAGRRAGNQHHLVLDLALERAIDKQTGSASWRERVGRYVTTSGGAVSLAKNKQTTTEHTNTA